MEALYPKLPDIIKTTLLISDGWLVGSSIRSAIFNEPVKDWDIIVPDGDRYMLAVSHLNSMYSSRINSFGGLKFMGMGMSIDIWQNSLDNFLTKASKPVTYIYHMRRNILLQNI